MSYLDEIMEQPAALRRFLAETPTIDLPGRAADYDRIILTGMGGSHFANYYLWRVLVARGIDAQHVAADELLSWPDLPAGPRTLVIAVSQSGGSGEVIAWVKRHAGRADVDILAVTNNPDAATLTSAARATVLIRAGDEQTVSTKTYLNTLAAHRLLAVALLGQPDGQVRADLARVADAVEAYLAGAWRAPLASWIEVDEAAVARVIIGRDSAVGTAEQGALIIKEAAKIQYEGLSAGQFRHGPLDLADPGLLAILIPEAQSHDGDAQASNRDAQFAAEIAGHGAAVIILGGKAFDGIPHIPTPAVPAGYEEFARIIPLELITIPLAEARGLVPGAFRHNQKVTTTL